MRYGDTAVGQARNTDMIVFLGRHMGFSFSIKGSEHRCVEHPSLSVKGDRLTWYWHSRGIGGRGALDFLIKIDGMGFRDAMARLAGAEVSPPPPRVTATSARTLILPEKAGFFYTRVYAYLSQTRGIDAGIIAALIQEKKLYEDKKGNIVFVGYDQNTVPRFASLRGTYTDNPFRMDCAGSDKRYGFKMDSMDKAVNDHLYIFESAIDCMSHATLEILKTGDKNAWRNDNRLSLGGTSGLALDKYLELHGGVGKLIFCLDNDTAGREAAALLAREYEGKDFVTRIEPPRSKDYNEDLIKFREEGLIVDGRKIQVNSEYR